MLLIFQHPDFPSDLVTLLAAVEATLEVVWKEEDGKERLSNHLNIMTLSTIPIHDSFKHGHRSSNHLPSDWLTISMERKLLRRILLPSLPSTTKLFTHKVEKLKITQVQNVFLFVQVALRTSGAHAYVSCAALLPLEVLLSDVFMEGKFNNFLSAVNTAKSITYMKLLGNILPVSYLKVFHSGDYHHLNAKYLLHWTWKALGAQRKVGVASLFFYCVK